MLDLECDTTPADSQGRTAEALAEDKNSFWMSRILRDRISPRTSAPGELASPCGPPCAALCRHQPPMTSILWPFAVGTVSGAIETCMATYLAVLFWQQAATEPCALATAALVLNLCAWACFLHAHSASPGSLEGGEERADRHAAYEDHLAAAGKGSFRIV